MEDRHTLSEPRFLEGHQTMELTWEVDIYRHGVAEPVDTILVSNTVLPPRFNKKGKILWRLPTEPGKIVRLFLIWFKAGLVIFFSMIFFNMSVLCFMVLLYVIMRISFSFRAKSLRRPYAYTYIQ